MIKKMVLVFVLLLFPSISFADEYVLVMSKEDNVCQHMLGLYNEDLRKYGEIKYDEHEEFKAIKWEEKTFYLTTPDGSRIEHKEKMLLSMFDINNDGSKEIVTKIEDSLRGQKEYSLDIFRKEDHKYFENEFDMRKNINKRIGTVGIFDRYNYPLKELPAKEPVPPNGYKSGYKYWNYYSMGPLFYVEPFLLNKTYYIDMRSDHDGYPWLVIVKYTKENSLKDICYYFKSLDYQNCKK